MSSAWHNNTQDIFEKFTFEVKIKAYSLKIF